MTVGRTEVPVDKSRPAQKPDFLARTLKGSGSGNKRRGRPKKTGRPGM
jgi:hypothetical protein